jgi:hypothetical protein
MTDPSPETSADTGPTALVLRSGRLVRSEGRARSTTEVTFDTPPLRWADLPADTRAAARHRSSPVVADQAVADDVLYQREDGALLQVMRAWRAHRDRLYLAVARRTVTIDEGRLQPTGDWERLALHRWDVEGEARRRVGTVPPGAPPTTAATTGGSPLPGADGPGRAAPRPEHASAARAWPYLPAAVRTRAERTVPIPQDWLGDLLQESVHRVPRAQTLTVLRRDEEKALVLRAHRALPTGAGRTAAAQAEALAACDWEVEQVVLPLARPLRLEATREEIPWI